MNNQSSTQAFLVMMFILAIAIAYPLALIWAMNTLFSLGIEYGLLQWIAASIIIQMFGGVRQMQQAVDNSFNKDQKI